MHKVQAILNAFMSALAPIKSNDVVKVILSSNTQPSESFPALVVRMGSDNVESRYMSGKRDSILNIYIDIYVHSKTLDLDAQVLAIREEVEKVILEHSNLGLPFVIDTRFSSQSEPDYGNDAELYDASITLEFEVVYRTTNNNPSV